uniref:WD40/YVTN/BNR-like repeat-containing protein n=1 Tax=Roseivirga sp. TaxID=1964215 RepID=UPI00404819A7
MKKLSLLLPILLLLACGNDKPKEKISAGIPFWEAQNSTVESSLRGLNAVSESVAWASGSKGAVLRTIDGGTTWQNVSISEADTIDFRDVQGFDENTAIVLSAGLPAVIYKTIDGGKSWQQKFFTMKEGTFYDAMDFWDNQNGIAFGDAVDGRLLILKTKDGGETWQELPFEQRPIAKDGQGGFAASGTCLITNGKSDVYIGLGGQEASFFYSYDMGETWDKTITPIQSGESTEGIFSIAFKNEKEGLIAGGDFRGDSLTRINSAYTVNKGQSWFPVMAAQLPKGYRSGVAIMHDGLVLTVGRESCSYFRDGMSAYEMMEGKYYSVSLSKDKKSAYASGPRGAIAKLKFK